jgi:outer membrane protein OmpA-like peptidoglycan-associated protein
MQFMEVSPALLRVVFLATGVLVILLCLFWPRTEDGNPKNGRAVLVIGLVLAALIMVPGSALQRRDERAASEQQDEREQKLVRLQNELSASVGELQEAKVELASLNNSATKERQLDAAREGAAEKALMEMATEKKQHGDILKLYFDESKSGLTFDSGRKDLTCDAREKLARIAIYLREERNIEKIKVIGHTDNTPRTGDPQFNQRLSEERAKEVVAYLQKAGVPSNLLTWEGRADRQPAGFDTDQTEQTIKEHNTDAEKPLNRRVEFDLTQKEPQAH